LEVEAVVRIRFVTRRLDPEQQKLMVEAWAREFWRRMKGRDWAGRTEFGVRSIDAEIEHGS
jgi:hypothetical protein